jgi:hypothetical protein
MPLNPTRVVAAMVVAAVAMAWSSSARADDRVVCVTASERGQRLRDEGKLRAARQDFIDCSRATCPLIVTRDCNQWLSELDVSLPSIVFSARDAVGNDLVEVRVLIDGSPLVETLDGRAVPVDLGVHALRSNAPAGRSWRSASLSSKVRRTGNWR